MWGFGLSENLRYLVIKGIMARIQAALDLTYQGVCAEKGEDEIKEPIFNSLKT
jgi:hypothetical protein